MIVVRRLALCCPSPAQVRAVVLAGVCTQLWAQPQVWEQHFELAAVTLPGVREGPIPPAVGKSHRGVRGCHVLGGSYLPKPGLSCPAGDSSAGWWEPRKSLRWQQGHPSRAGCRFGAAHGTPASAGPSGDVTVLGHSQAAGTHMPRTHGGVNVEHFLVQGAMSDARAASLGLFSPSCWVREGGMGQRQSCRPVFAVRLFLVMLSMVFLLWRH